MTVRNIKKNLAGAEDLLHGIGIESQSRGGAIYEMHKLDTYVPTYDVEEMKRSSLTFMRMYWTDTNYTDFRRNPVGTIGIASDLGGVWEVAGDSLKLRQLLARQAAEAGFNLVDGSFEEGANISGWPDVVWSQANGKYYQWPLDEAKTVAAGSAPTNIGPAWLDKSDVTLHNFACIADIDGNVSLGDKVFVENYYLNGNSGALFFTVVAAGTGTHDGGKYIDLPLSGLQLSQNIKIPYNLRACGAKGDGVTDDTAAIQAALNTGLKVVGNASDTYAVSGKGVISADGQIFDGQGCTFLWIGTAQVDKYDSPIAISGGGETTTLTTVTNDVGSYQTEITVADGSNFSAGDYAVFKYSVRQGDGVTQPPIACNPFGGEEYIVRITNVNGNTVFVDRPRAFPMFSAPPGGGALQLIKVDVVKDAHVKNYTFTQQTPGALVCNSATSVYYGADCSVDNVNCHDISGLGIICKCAHKLDIMNCSFKDSTFQGSGQGYGVQLASGCSFVNIDRVYGSNLRHLVDISNCSGYVNVTNCVASRASNGAIGSHGGFEHDILYDGNKCLNSGTGIYLGTSGDEFGNKSKNITISNHASQFCDTGIYGGLGTMTRPENVSISNYTSYRDIQGGSTTFDIRLQADNVTIADSYVSGGVWLEDTYADEVTDVLISNTVLAPFASAAISNSVVGAAVVLDNCVVKGSLDVRAGADIVLDGCIIETSRLFVERSEIINSITIDGCTIKVLGTFSNTVRVNDWLFTNNISEMNGFYGRFNLDGTSNPITRVMIDSNKGDVCHSVRRALKVTVTNNQQLVGADEFFNIVQSNNAKIVIANNTLQKVSTNAYCIDFGDYSSPDFNGSNWVVMGNLHNGTLRLKSATGTIAKMTAIGNIHSPDAGDTITQASVTPTSTASLVVANNVGW